MDTSVLKNFAQESRRYLMDVVAKKIEYYLTSDNVDIRAKKHLIEELKKEISNTSKAQVVEKIAYTWFNRFCALRYMDVKQYSLVGVLTPMSESHTQPEILMEAKSGHIKDELGNPSSRDHVIGLLSGKVSSIDPQSEAYKHLVLMACNYYHSMMPFLFEKIDDYTELLMPDDLLSEASIISNVREALNEENCKDVEVIGWLYQFYISEKKDEVFDELKKNKKITPENIPAATQLFTPNWIVRYLVENSLGHLWMLNRPNSSLLSKMNYYIKPVSEEVDFIKIKGPEEIKVCDPACGSGHMLVYAFDLLYSMYEEEGIDSNEIPSLILKNNLFGIEIDKRAGELAAFALTMKARERQRRYFKAPVHPNICILEKIHFEDSEINDYMDHVGRDLFSSRLQATLAQFEDAKNYGSLIRPEVTDVENILRSIEVKNVSGHLFLSQTHSRVLKTLSQADFLAPKYHVVIANPPYMGGKGMNESLKKFLDYNYKLSKFDLMTSFMERMISLCRQGGFWGMINLPTWMFTSTYSEFRDYLLKNVEILSLIHPGRGVFGSDFGSVALVLKNAPSNDDSVGVYRQLFENQIFVKNNEEIQRLFHKKDYKRFLFRQLDFFKIPGSPIAYWTSEKIRQVFEINRKLGESCAAKQGIATGENDTFLRFWFEVDYSRIDFSRTCIDDSSSKKSKWFPYSKGGAARKWYGNLELIVNWENDGHAIKNFTDENGKLRSRPQNLTYQFREAATWSLTAASVMPLCARWRPSGCMFDINGMSAFGSDEISEVELVCLLSSSSAGEFIKIINPTFAFQSGDVGNIPLPKSMPKDVKSIGDELIQLSKLDWDSFETSWDFKANELVRRSSGQSLLSSVYLDFINDSEKAIQRMRTLEIENNKLFIEAFNLEDEIPYDVNFSEVTLLSNPKFRYDSDKPEMILASLMQSDVIKDLISYAVGCVFGRYSPHKEGIILANSGSSHKDVCKLIGPNAAFQPDKDNIVPILEDDWFSDDMSELFKNFLKITFGVKDFEKNLNFIEESLGKDIRSYFSKDFYNDHIKRYKKRPIYWMFSSPKGSFNVLIYIHRYHPDSVSIILNNYLREFRTKISAKKEHLERIGLSDTASGKDKSSAIKEIEKIKKVIVELDEYEKDILYPLATQRLDIDLDDGIKVNYPKFGKALKLIKGLDKDED